MPNTPGAGRRRGGGDRRRDRGRRRRPRLGRGGARRGGAVVRVPEGLLDAVTGPVGLGARLRVPGGRGADRGRGARRPAAPDQPGARHQTLLGAARLLDESPDGPEALRAAVTSPGGTTAAGLRALESDGVRAAFLDAVVAATERSRELGRADAHAAAPWAPLAPPATVAYSDRSGVGRGLPHGCVARPVPDPAGGRRPAAGVIDDRLPADQGRASCARSASARRTASSRTTSTPTSPPASPRPADRRRAGRFARRSAAPAHSDPHGAPSSLPSGPASTRSASCPTTARATSSSAWSSR